MILAQKFAFRTFLEATKVFSSLKPLWADLSLEIEKSRKFTIKTTKQTPL